MVTMAAVRNKRIPPSHPFFDGFGPISQMGGEKNVATLSLEADSTHGPARYQKKPRIEKEKRFRSEASDRSIVMIL